MPNEIERRDLFQEMTTLRSRIDRLIESTFTRPRGEWLATFLDYPAMDIYEADGNVKVNVPLPGVKPDEVEVTITGNTLMIKGERKSKEEVKDDRYYRREMHYGTFTRSVVLPETADAAKPQAVFENGVLTITFPQVAAIEAKRVEVKVAEPEEHLAHA